MWRMKGNFKWGSVLDVTGNTRFTFKENDSGEFRVVSYYETWEMEPSAAVLQLVTPRKTERAGRKVEEYKDLIINAYLVSSVAHIADIAVGDGVLLQQSGVIGGFSALPFVGKAAVSTWAGAGLVTKLIATAGKPGLGMGVYGFVEVLAAFLAPNSDTFVNAIAVQGLIAGCYLVVRLKDGDIKGGEETEEKRRVKEGIIKHGWGGGGGEQKKANE